MLTIDRLPLPRLELRWFQEDEPYHWRCIYRLFLPCKDARDEEGRGWIAVELGTTRRTCDQEPLNAQGQPDTPLRDGIHCRRDAAVLTLPAYAIYGEHVRQLEPMPWEEIP